MKAKRTVITHRKTSSKYIVILLMTNIRVEWNKLASLASFAQTNIDAWQLAILIVMRIAKGSSYTMTTTSILPLDKQPFTVGIKLDGSDIFAHVVFPPFCIL